jgi:hypothetical protein
MDSRAKSSAFLIHTTWRHSTCMRTHPCLSGRSNRISTLSDFCDLPRASSIENATTKILTIYYYVLHFMRSMRSMCSGFIFRNRGALLKVHHGQCLTSMTKHDVLRSHRRAQSMCGCGKHTLYAVITRGQHPVLLCDSMWHYRWIDGFCWTGTSVNARVHALCMAARESPRRCSHAYFWAMHPYSETRLPCVFVNVNSKFWLWEPWQMPRDCVRSFQEIVNSPEECQEIP